jgi:hypothetical protein
VIAGCGGGDDQDDPQPTETTEATSEQGVTRPGTELSIGEPAVVRFTANPQHDSLITLNVTAINPGKITDLQGFGLDPKTKQSNVFYVRANVTNSGTGDLGGQRIILYGKAADNLVVPPVVFGSSFPKCNNRPLAKPFGPDARTAVCMVMLAPAKGTISAVQWRPADGTEPITWSAS